MKLELKHLAPYSPHRLKGCEHVFTQSPKDTRIFELTAIHPKEKEEFIWDEVNGKGSRIDCKPILRPLSDLTKDKFFKELFILIGGGYKDYKTFKNAQLNNYLCNDPLQYSYRVIELLFEYHFDVFGLIEKGLAIDINKIEN